MAISKRKTVPVNDKIKAQKVLLIHADGNKKGILDIADALEEAKNASLDLVQVSPSDSDPVQLRL